MKDRIQEYMDHNNINAGELAIRLEVQRSNISHILNGRNKPSAAFIEKMLIVFPDLNARWLLTGEGTMIDAAEKDQEHNNQNTISSAANTPETSSEQKVVQADQANATNLSAKSQLPLPDISDDSIDKIILLYRDGTFSSFGRK